MLTVHGFWSVERGLCLWAEDSERRVKSPSDALRAARPHPFAASTDQLAELHDGKPDSSILLLPSVRTAPLDSPELVRVRQRPQPTRSPSAQISTSPSRPRSCAPPPLPHSQAQSSTRRRRSA